MKWLGSMPSAAVSEPLRLLLKQCLKQGLPAPVGLVFIDPDGLWRNAIAGLTLAERRACIAVALDDDDLVSASRWSIGGGVLLPPSISRVSAACRAAEGASSLLQWIADPIAHSELRKCDSFLNVGLRPREIWNHLVGLLGQLELLTALAGAVERPAVIGPGPTLALTGVSRVLIEAAWEGLETTPRWATDKRCLVFDQQDSGTKRAEPLFESRSWPVAQWPSGRIVGGWTIDPTDQDQPWRLMSGDGMPLLVEAVGARKQLDRVTAGVIRVHGIPASDLERDGSPGAVVVETLAREAHRNGTDLWIPGVTQIAGTVIRRWGLPVWVDGPVLKG